MNEDRQSAYLNLIEELLTCPSGEEPEILNANSDLIDAGLTATLADVELEQAESIAGYLGNFSNRMQEFPLGNRANNLEIAIAGYGIALTVFTRERFPQDWATTQNNLGAAYSNRIRGEKAENLEAAIACYLEALKECTRERFPQAWATTQNNLGAAYSNRIRGEKAENLEAAIACYLEALKERTRERFPQDWATTQNNLGAAYSNRIRGEKAENLEAAIACYLEALKEYTRERFPQDWAMTQNNLGNAYSDRIRGEKAENLEAAIACYLEALKERTRERFPQNHTETLFNLGLVYRETKQFQKAYNRFKAACDTVELLRDEIISGEEAKQKLAEEWNNLYQNMVQVCLELHNYPQAIEYIERSKTRNLAELILTRDIHSIFPPEIVSQLQELGEEIAGGQKQVQTGTAENPIVLAQRLTLLRSQRNELQNRYLPIGSGFNFQQFQRTLDEHTAIIQWYVMGDKFLTFIVKPNPPAPFPAREGGEFPPSPPRRGGLGGEVIYLWQSTSDDLQALENWRNSYLQDYYKQQDNWRNQLTSRLEELAKILHLDEIIQHIPKKCDRLILVPHRYLHLLPLHALPITGKSCFLDLFPEGVSYAPSCQLWIQSQQRKRPNFSHLFAIQNPTEDLIYTDLEVQQIIKNFQPVNLLEKTAATLTAITETSLKNIHCAHFSCHGYFHPTIPQKSALILAGARLDSTSGKLKSERHLEWREGESCDLDKCLTLEKIFSLKLEQCRLVTLSACETGLIDFSNNSDEYIGLPSGFLIAGSSNVVSSLWRVSDFSTTLLMVKFYKILHSENNITVSKALNQAQIWLKNIRKDDLLDWIRSYDLSQDWMEKIDKYLKLFPNHYQPFQKPEYWAAFCSNGQ
ncbi:MAG: CHAT domain-containing protein [Potamolinea sp.]